MKIMSTAFSDGGKIPKPHAYEGEGRNLSPELRWSGLPDGTQELALICDDPDAPRPQPWVHWAIYKISADQDGLPEGIAAEEDLEIPAGAVQGENSWGEIGYGGPMPPPGHGTHHYHFTLYALDAELDLAPGLTKEQLLKAMEGHVLAEAETVGTYKR